MERWKPNLNDEDEPRVNLNIGAGEFLAHRGNTRLYTHMGRLAIYDHIFCSGEESGFYIFNFIDGYEQFKQYMLDHDYPMYLNQTEVSQVDVDAYDRVIQRSVSDIDYIPDEWI